MTDKKWPNTNETHSHRLVPHERQWKNNKDAEVTGQAVELRITNGGLLHNIVQALVSYPDPDVRELGDALSEYTIGRPVRPLVGSALSSMDHGGAFVLVCKAPDLSVPDAPTMVKLSPNAEPVAVPMDRLVP